MFDKAKTHLRNHKTKYIVTGGVVASAAAGYVLGRRTPKFVPGPAYVVVTSEGESLANVYEKEYRLPADALQQAKKFYDRIGGKGTHLIAFRPTKVGRKTYDYHLSSSMPVA